MAHSLFILCSILILIKFFYNFHIMHKKKVMITIFSLAIVFNLSKNLIRISDNDFINHPYKLIEHKVYKQEKLRLNKFEYFSGWYGKYPTGNRTLKNLYAHKKILIFDIIYKINK